MSLGHLLIHNGFGPLEGRSIAVVHLSERVDRLAHLRRAGEAGASQSRARQDAEPHLDLIEPRSVSGSEVQVHLGMALQPAITLGLMSVQVVQNDMERALGYCATIWFIKSRNSRRRRRW